MGEVCKWPTAEERTAKFRTDLALACERMTSDWYKGISQYRCLMDLALQLASSECQCNMSDIAPHVRAHRPACIVGKAQMLLGVDVSFTSH